jgi:hypothetical protein
MVGGIVAAVLVGYRIVVPPGQSSFVHPAWGAYLALVSALVMVAGGVLSRAEDPEPLATPMPPPAADWSAAAAPPASWSSAQSVRPPQP